MFSALAANATASATGRLITVEIGAVRGQGLLTTNVCKSRKDKRSSLRLKQ